MDEKELQFSKLANLFDQYPGKYFLKYEQEQLNSILAQFHGYFLVQLSTSDHYHLQSVTTIKQQVYVGRGIKDNPQLSVVESSLHELPFQSESVDAFILPHTLEFSQNPEKLIGEIYNILIPGGKIVILAFNPFSLLGMTKLLKSSKNTPWCGKLYSIGHVKSWLHASGFSLDYQKSFCFRPPLKNETALKKLFFLEPIGQYCYPRWGNIYILVAQKKIVGLPPVKMKIFTPKIPVTGGFPEPSTNKSL